MTGALSDVRVIDLTRMLSGPVAGMLLADLGADVIKIEPPEGDPYRQTSPMTVRGRGVNFVSVNRNKRSVVLDLRAPDDLDVLHCLIAGADVVLENFRPSVSETIGLRYDQLQTINPAVVACSITGYGSTGELKDLPAVDPIIQAMAGVMDLTGEPDGPPMRTGAPVGDIYAGLLAVQGVLAALHERGGSGLGQQVEVSLLDATLLGLTPREGRFLATGISERRTGDLHPSLAPFQRLPAKDRDIFVAVVTDAMWRKLCPVLGRADLLDDPRFATQTLRRENVDALTAELTVALAEDTAESWQFRLGAVGVPAGPINSLGDILSSPAVRDSPMLVTVPDGDGEIRLLGNPIRLSRTPVQIRTPPPHLGEHTDEVLASLAFEDHAPAATPAKES